MDTKDNNHSVNGLEFELFPPPTAPPLDNENNLKSLELQEIQDIKENLLTGIDNLFKIIECCKEKNLKEESSCEGWKKTLEIQKKQVNDLILAILFIGSMKSGKSTLLSAISGLDVFPGKHSSFHNMMDVTIFSGCTTDDYYTDVIEI